MLVVALVFWATSMDCVKNRFRSFAHCAIILYLPRTTGNLRVASSSLACVTFVFFLWQGRPVQMPMNTASRGLSKHSKTPHLSGCVSKGEKVSFSIALVLFVTHQGALNTCLLYTHYVWLINVRFYLSPQSTRVPLPWA